MLQLPDMKPRFVSDEFEIEIDDAAAKSVNERLINKALYTASDEVRHLMGAKLTPEFLKLMKPGMPRVQPGDVIQVKWAKKPEGKWYSYVRGESGWVVETDEYYLDINNKEAELPVLWEDGRVRILVLHSVLQTPPLSYTQ
jgi:hypothetical protein